MFLENQAIESICGQSMDKSITEGDHGLEMAKARWCEKVWA